MKITKGVRVEFENGRDMLRGTVASLHSDPKRPEMEETWTVFADSVLVKEPDGHKPGDVLLDREGNPRLDSKGNAKQSAPTPVFKETWLQLVDENGLQACDENGIALHKNFAGDPLQLVKHGVPVPFRVRARRLKRL